MPHGGYVTSCILRVASIHFRTTLARCNHPHTISLHLSFLRRSAVGRAVFTVSVCKIGRTTSVVHISVSQGGGAGGGGGATAAAPFVVGYLTQANLASESGVSLPTHFTLAPAPLPRGSTAALRADTDPHWALQPQPLSPWRKALRQVHTYIPRGLRVAGDTADEWICFASGERFTQESLGFVCDTFPLIPDKYGLRDNPEQLAKISVGSEHNAEPKRIQGASPSSQSSLLFNSRSQPLAPPPGLSPTTASPTKEIDLARFWFPTLVLNIEFKKLLPPEGVEWLFVRVRPKLIRNGRMDLEVIVMDEEGDIVALSWHVALLVSGERNSRGRL